MNWFLLSDEGVQSLEDRVDVAHGRGEVENATEVDSPGDLRVGAHELGEIAFGLPRFHRMALDEPIGIVARHAAVDEREQQAVAEDEAMTRVEVPPHAVCMD